VNDDKKDMRDKITKKGKSMKKFHVFCLLAMIISCHSILSAEDKWAGKKSDWSGFEKYTFKFENKTAWVKVPKKSAPGNPWVWRGRWADFHTGTDLILLQKGFHIAYLETGGMLGCDAALDLWDKFYDEMTGKYKMSKKPALEAVSRGGLFVLRWAARHPDRVSCIYLDSPVCDIKSWPLGKWKGDHDATGIHQLATYYGLKTEDAIISYDKNPVDDVIAEPIAKAKIPILAIVNKDDRIVPPSENIEIFAKKYKHFGGTDIEIIHPRPETKTALKGHHFQVPNPKKSADFIEEYTQKK
jgi:sialidase-1